MNPMRAVMSGLSAANLLAVSVALRNRASLREYISGVHKLYRQISRLGLPSRSPIEFLFETGRAKFRPESRMQIPPILHGGGGTATDELIYLAAVAHVLQPRLVFEIGTFTGLTTSLFILNSAPGARIISVDLPPNVDVSNCDYIGTDQDLVRNRRVGYYTQLLGLADRYEQWLCDSMEIDPEPLVDTVELGFIDGAHALPYVRNDTEKMARMITDGGIVLWHDYGGIGEFRPLSVYLEELASLAPVWLIPQTSTAWCIGANLKEAIKRGKQGVH